LLQFDFVYGILNQSGNTAATGTGAVVDTNLARLRAQSGITPTTGTALFTSVKPARYKAGEGITARFTTVFGSPKAGNVQEIGAGTTENGYFYGFNGTSFGILYRNSSSGSLVETWIPQTDWNGDKADGTGASLFNWNPFFGNVCMIRYAFLGFGDVNFFVQDSLSGRFILVHTIRYANSSANVQLSNPTLGFWVRCANTGGNTSNVTLYVGSVGFFMNGLREYTNGRFSADSAKSGVTTETNILTIKNATTFNGITNKGVVKLESVSFGGNVNGVNPSGYALLKIKKDVTLGGTPNFTPISGTTSNNGATITNGQSLASIDIAGTTITGGVPYFSISANMNNGYQVDLSPYNIFILPTETITVSIYCSNSALAFASFNWVEDI